LAPMLRSRSLTMLLLHACLLLLASAGELDVLDAETCPPSSRWAGTGAVSCQLNKDNSLMQVRAPEVSRQFGGAAVAGEVGAVRGKDTSLLDTDARLRPASARVLHGETSRAQGQPRSRRAPGSRDSKHIIWLHLHKYGGTTMCIFANKLGERCPTSNCNMPGDGPSEKNPRKQVLCKARVDSSSYTFSAVERFLVPGDLTCPEALSGTMLRDPLAAVKSHMAFHQYTAAEKAGLLRKLSVSGTGSLAMLQWSTNNVPEWDTYQHVDNFATRSLSGNYLSQPRAVTEHDLEKAKAALMRLDVVLVLEELSKHAAQLEHSFGWSLSEAALESHHNSKKHKDDFFSQEEEEFVKAINVWDYKLYAFAQSLAANRTEQARLAIDGQM